MLRIGVKQTSGTSRIHPMSQNAVLEMFADKQFESVLTVRFWQSTNPVSPVNGDLWYQSVTNVLYYREAGAWYEIEIRLDTIYIKATDASTYYYNGLIMIALGAVLTKAAIEALLTGVISSHSHAADATKLDATKTAVEALIYNDVLLLTGTDVDLSLNDVFDRSVTPLTGATTFTILNPIKYKPFRLILKGGSLNVPTFSTYTVNWINTSLVTDYVNTITNVLWCEIRATGKIYCFWGN